MSTRAPSSLAAYASSGAAAPSTGCRGRGYRRRRLLAVAILVIVIASVAKRGAGAIDLNFLTKTPSPELLIGGTGPSGIANAIVGSLIIVGIVVLMALPVGILAAIYLNEFAHKRVANVLTMALDVLNGVPAIVIGIFVFVLPGRRSRADRLEGRVRPLDPDAADGCAVDPGGAGTRSRLAS